ncbi:hypothetical protein FIBSPDRAFT_887169 [Athelia psychrophila]|uniref:Uncharacterized protein n=1 Tax=Athelia psychrophila TaxID=1759441 RepID=A0A166Q273_9AGAM|nr:hypothetical protein FIBSPDRAFT_887169 [Fibularhizoctonia sp. CBS 109695]
MHSHWNGKGTACKKQADDARSAHTIICVISTFAEPTLTGVLCQYTSVFVYAHNVAYIVVAIDIASLLGEAYGFLGIFAASITGMCMKLKSGGLCAPIYWLLYLVTRSMMPEKLNTVVHPHVALCLLGALFATALSYTLCMAPTPSHTSLSRAILSAPDRVSLMGCDSIKTVRVPGLPLARVRVARVAERLFQWDAFFLVATTWVAGVWNGNEGGRQFGHHVVGASCSSGTRKEELWISGIGPPPGFEDLPQPVAATGRNLNAYRRFRAGAQGAIKSRIFPQASLEMFHNTCMRYKSNYETIQNTSTKGLWDLVIEIHSGYMVENMEVYKLEEEKDGDREEWRDM